MRDLPPELMSGPFTRSRARELGVTSRMLDGRRFVRVHPRVYRWVGHEMTDSDWVQAARLALPAHAHLTGLSLIQELGLVFGPRTPVHFVVAGDLHLVIPGVFLHRTKRLPPVTGRGVCNEAAFIAYCTQARVIDAIKVGDWLLHHDHMELAALVELATAQLWRDGAHEALYVSNHLEAGSKSLKESEVRSMLLFAGLPLPEVNAAVDLSGNATVEADLVYRTWPVIIEYEGVQHQEDRLQYTADLDRYSSYRDGGFRYVQVTKEHLHSPKNVVRKVHRQLVLAGYDGPAPAFGENWRVLFARVRTVLGPRTPAAGAA
jgi:hypothetical protein